MPRTTGPDCRPVHNIANVRPCLDCAESSAATEPEVQTSREFPAEEQVAGQTSLWGFLQMTQARRVSGNSRVLLLLLLAQLACSSWHQYHRPRHPVVLLKDTRARRENLTSDYSHPVFNSGMEWNAPRGRALLWTSLARHRGHEWDSNSRLPGSDGAGCFLQPSSSSAGSVAGVATGPSALALASVAN